MHAQQSLSQVQFRIPLIFSQQDQKKGLMVLKTVMEDKQLNFNQPLLSARKYTTTATSRRTYRKKPDHDNINIPHLPPHRPDQKSGPVRNPGTVPFIWEQMPGQPKEHIKHQPQISHIKLPPGRCDPKAIETRDRSESGDSEEEAYVDALDTLSRTESFFINCSMSGVDDLDVKQSRSFPKDREAMELMMDRFLPAAMAMASEKETVVQEHSQLVKKVVNQNKPALRYGPSFAKRYSHYQDEEEEDDESDDDDDQNRTGVCGLLPRFCLNPVPGLSVRTRVQQRRTSSSTGSYSETSHEEKGFGLKTFQELLADKDSQNESDSKGPIIEKTLYVDTIQKVEPKVAIDSSLEDFNIVSNMEMKQKEAKESLEENLSRAIIPYQDDSELPPPPPLPKSPSDSWLWRTLPSVSAKNTSLRSYLSTTTPQNKSPKAHITTNDLKWETIVKTTKNQRRHLHYSEDVLTTIPEA